jgi:hypothetical protein
MKINVMKKFVLLMFFMVCGNIAFSQNQLAINLVHCKDTVNDDVFGFGEVVVYRDDSLFATDKSSYAIKFFDNVPDGKYKVKYKTFFNTQMSKEVLISKKHESTFYDLNLCIDKPDDSIYSKTDNLFLRRIKNGEHISVIYSFAGCFNSGSDSLVILKKNNKLYLSYKNRQRKIKKRELDYFFQFETEMRNVLPLNFISTGNSLNTLSYNGEIFMLDEPSGFWSGFDYLKKQLKLK